MKQNQTARLMRPGFTGMAVNRRINMCRSAVRSIAICALVAQCLNPARAAEALPVKQPGSQTTPIQKPAYSPQGYQMERYKAFARQAEMPVITVTNATTLEVGDIVKVDVKRPAQLSSREKEAFASQFGVSAGVIGRLLERASNNPPPSAAQIAQDLRTAVVDYRFLEGEWERYNPPPEGQKLKADALQALQTGDISKAWQLYDGLQKPAPPGNLRAISSQ